MRLFCNTNEWILLTIKDRFCPVFWDMSIKKINGVVMGNNDQFNIQARSCTLLEGESCLWQNDLSFRVPIYQRAYSWGEHEIEELLSDF